jgi:hypothetical protein
MRKRRERAWESTRSYAKEMKSRWGQVVIDDYLDRRTHPAGNEKSGPDPHSRQAVFNGPLAEGTHTLEIKTHHLFEREGPVSRAVIDKKPDPSRRYRSLCAFAHPTLNAG